MYFYIVLYVKIKVCSYEKKKIYCDLFDLANKSFNKTADFQ